MTSTATGATGRTCAARRRDGQPCGSWAGAGSDFCQAHDPARAAQMAAARAAGGRARHGRSLTPRATDRTPVKLSELADALPLLASTVDEVRTLENSIGRARAVGYLVSVWGDVYSTCELERRVAALEALLAAGTREASQGLPATPAAPVTEVGEV